jgi:hypothetical protein
MDLFLFILTLNSIFLLYFILYREGDLTTLRVHAVCHPTNETFTEYSHASKKLLDSAGPKLIDELVNKIKCK